MTEQEAIKLAALAFFTPGCKFDINIIRARKCDEVSVRNPRPGWIVVIPLDIPDGFEPNVAFVEVYEHNREVVIPNII